MSVRQVVVLIVPFMELKCEGWACCSSGHESLNRTFYGIEISVVMLFNTGRKVLIVPFMELKYKDTVKRCFEIAAS